MTARPEWPKTEPNADTMLTWLAGEYLHRYVQSFEYHGIHWKDHDPSWMLTLNLMTLGVVSLHDTYCSLKRLREISPISANATAAMMWLAAEAGDSYGEWAWQWAIEEGLDPDVIADEAKTQIRDLEERFDRRADEVDR